MKLSSAIPYPNTLFSDVFDQQVWKNKLKVFLFINTARKTGHTFFQCKKIQRRFFLKMRRCKNCFEISINMRKFLRIFLRKMQLFCGV